jgi:RNA polymerase sigma factor (sigma-70 family)
MIRTKNIMLRLPNDSQLFGAVRHQTYNTSSSQDYFATTHWSLVINAGNSQSLRHESALNELCSLYWFPLYAYARHCGNADADAKDLVQGFYSHFLKKNYLRNLSSENGRFRAFLLACFKNYSRNEWKRNCCQKRGGGADHLPIDWATADETYQSQLMTAETPDRAYDRAWVVTLLKHVLSQLGQEWQAEGKRELFEELKPLLTVDGDDFSYRAAAERLKMSEGATRKEVERLRKRYRELIREEIRTTCAPEAVEQEIWSLLNAFSD